MSALAVDLIDSYDAFARLEQPWNETVERAGLTHPFLRHEWLRSWWDAFGGDRTLSVVVMRAGRRIVALAPLMLERARMYGVGVKRVQFLHNDHTPKADVIVTEREDEVYEALWKTLLSAQRQWDVVQFSQLPSDSPTHVHIARLAGPGHPTAVWMSDDSPYLALTSNWDDYLSTRHGKLRQTLRNRINRVTQLGAPTLEILSDPAEIRDARDEALALEASGWKQQAGTSICSDPAVRRFYTLLAERAAASGWLRLLFLTVNGRRVAAGYASCYDDRLAFFKTGYDPEFAKYGPFKMLTYFTIRDGYAAGLKEVDFLGDAEPWKLEWTSTTRPHDWLFVFGNTTRSRLVHTLKYRVRPALKRWLH